MIHGAFLARFLGVWAPRSCLWARRQASGGSFLCVIRALTGVGGRPFMAVSIDFSCGSEGVVKWEFLAVWVPPPISRPGRFAAMAGSARRPFPDARKDRFSGRVPAGGLWQIRASLAFGFRILDIEIATNSHRSMMGKKPGGIATCPGQSIPD